MKATDLFDWYPLRGLMTVRPDYSSLEIRPEEAAAAVRISRFVSRVIAVDCPDGYQRETVLDENVVALMKDDQGVLYRFQADQTRGENMNRIQEEINAAARLVAERTLTEAWPVVEDDPAQLPLF